jgi:hypothetical protein
MTAAGALALPTPARAASFTFDYDIFSPTEPSGTGPWLQALIEDDDAATDTVTITLTSLLQDSSEFFSGANDDPTAPVGIAFNLKTFISLSGSCTVVQGDGCLEGGPQLAQPQPFGSVNGISSDPQFQGFDVALFLAPPTEGVRFNNNDIIRYRLSGTGLSADQFVATNPSGYCSAAKIGAAPATVSALNGSSTVIAAFCPGSIPSSQVPAPLPLLGAGAAFGFSRKLRRRIGQATAAAHTPSA